MVLAEKQFERINYLFDSLADVVFGSINLRPCFYQGVNLRRCQTGESGHIPLDFRKDAFQIWEHYGRRKSGRLENCTVSMSFAEDGVIWRSIHSGNLTVH